MSLKKKSLNARIALSELTCLSYKRMPKLSPLKKQQIDISHYTTYCEITLMEENGAVNSCTIKIIPFFDYGGYWSQPSLCELTKLNRNVV